jgi:predicted ATP-binding protein involved in virulence
MKMYKLDNVTINGFWQRFRIEGHFNPDVNIIIGRNGTGKTTFMNILHSVLAVDIDGLANCDFQSIEIRLRNKQKLKTIKVSISDVDAMPYSTAEYQISNTKYHVRLVSSDDRRHSPMHRRRMIEETEGLRHELESIVSLSSLSVYRLRNGDNLEIRDRNTTYALAPVDYRLQQLLSQLTTYQLELSQQARLIATELQKDVLGSILYSSEEAKDLGLRLEFDKEKEKRDLTSAYKQLDAYDSIIRKKITAHVEGIDKTIQSINAFKMSSERDEEITLEIDYRSLQALASTQNIIKLSLEAERKTSDVFTPINLLTQILSEFIKDKTFNFIAGELIVCNTFNTISVTSLSSGEKQLLILFIETTLQRNKEFIFLTDEPEISLHISWQRQIIPAVKRINPNAQVIAATHSPEVAAKYKESIVDMEKMIHG